jgi:UDP-glucose 4-epimerase
MRQSFAIATIIIDWARERVPGLVAEISGPDTANIIQDTALKTGMWGAYDIARIERDTDWRPRSGKEAFHAYMDWIAEYEVI